MTAVILVLLFVISATAQFTSIPCGQVNITSCPPNGTVYLVGQFKQPPRSGADGGMSGAYVEIEIQGNANQYALYTDVARECVKKVRGCVNEDSCNNCKKKDDCIKDAVIIDDNPGKVQTFYYAIELRSQTTNDTLCATQVLWRLDRASATGNMPTCLSELEENTNLVCSGTVGLDSKLSFILSLLAGTVINFILS